MIDPIIDNAIKIITVRLDTVERTSMGLLHILKEKGLLTRTETKQLKKFVISGDSQELNLAFFVAKNGVQPGAE